MIDEESYLFTMHNKTYVRIYGSFESTRDQMIRRNGDNWLFQYHESEIKEVKRLGYTYKI